MNQPQSAKSASVSRPVRRSLAEFALPPTGVAGELPSAARLLPTAQPLSATQRDGQPLTRIDDQRHDVMHEPLNEDQEAAAGPVGQASDLDGAKLEDSALFHQFEDMTLAAAKAAKDYRSWMLEYMKINMTAALNCANGLAGVNSRVASAAHPDAPEEGEPPPSQSVEKTTPPMATDHYRAKAFEFMTANVSTTLEYAQRLARAKTPTEFMELSTRHARQQFELIVKQTTELGSIAQRLAAPDIASMTAGITKVCGERQE